MIIDTFTSIKYPISILWIETEQDVDKIQYPEFIDVLKEVTDDEKFDTYHMAHKDYKLPEEEEKIFS